MSVSPVVKTVTVPLGPDQAFELFTLRMNEWWPVGTHSVSAQAGQTSRALNVAPGVGGEIIETGHDGGQHVWGTVLEWSPGDAFACTWHPGRSDGRNTEVRVVFEAVADGTRVTLTHSGWDALGDEAEKTRDGYDNGWIGVMERFSEAA